MITVYLGLGSNRGDKQAYMKNAVLLLGELGIVSAVSTLYETEPFGIEDQETFLNGVCAFETNLSPRELLEHILEIEKQLGRVRSIKNGPRTIDIDILLYGDEIIDENDLQIPHPGISERWCVLKPLVDIAPDVVHPVLKKTAKELLDELPEDAIGQMKK